MQRKTNYSFSEINELQTNIMKFVTYWVREKKTPVPLAEIIKKMKQAGTHDFTTVNACNSLLDKGYIRRGYASSNKTLYVALRSV